jgi:NitT/TauT family transport system substrate-binding protein
MYTRRQALQTFSAGAAGIGLAGVAAPLLRPAWAADQTLSLNLLGYALAIHVPATAGILEILPSMKGYTAPKINRMEQIRTLTQSLIAGDADFGETDYISTMRAVQSGADLVIIGNFYVNTSLVLTVNADKVKTIEDLLKPGIRIAVNGKGDGTHVSWAGALVEKGLDPSKVQVVEIGGSGSRTRALLSGKIDGCPMHFDQAESVMKQGNYKVLVEPWKVYHPWLNEPWVTSSATLKKPGKERAAVDLMKATITAFRKANSDFDWYAAMYRKYATIKGAKEAPASQIRPIWEELKGAVKAWPDDMNFKIENAERLLPIYQKTGVVKGPIDFKKFMTTKYVDQALAELG